MSCTPDIQRLPCDISLAHAGWRRILHASRLEVVGSSTSTCIPSTSCSASPTWCPTTRRGISTRRFRNPNLINPWGVAFGPKGPFWVNNNHTGTATVYSVDPMTDATTAVPLVITIAPPAGTEYNGQPDGHRIQQQFC